MNIPELEKMWFALADIPINLDDEIESDFYWWAKGTYRLIFGIGLMKNCQVVWQWILIWYYKHYGITHKHR
jgi:hypothetical protein